MTTTAACKVLTRPLSPGWMNEPSAVPPDTIAAVISQSFVPLAASSDETGIKTTRRTTKVESGKLNTLSAYAWPMQR